MGYSKNDIELFNEQTGEESVFTPESWMTRHSSVAGQPPSLRNWIFCYLPALRGLIKKRFQMQDPDFKPPFAIHTLIFRKHRIHITYPGIGAPLAAMRLEEAASLGARRIVFVGYCGYLAPAVRQGDILLPIKAVRDEGTSFHYAEPARYSAADPRLSETLKSQLHERQIPFIECTVWTTDAPYREIPSKITRLRREGVCCVDMEASALFSAGTFKHIAVSGLLIARDPVPPDLVDKPVSGNIRIFDPDQILETLFSSLISSE